MTFVEREYINKLVDKFNDRDYEEDELDNFCSINFNADGTVKNYTACYNIDGDCYVEVFDHFESVVLYLETDCGIACIREFDEVLEEFKLLHNIRLNNRENQHE